MNLPVRTVSEDKGHTREQMSAGQPHAPQQESSSSSQTHVQTHCDFDQHFIRFFSGKITRNSNTAGACRVPRTEKHTLGGLPPQVPYSP